MRSDGGEELHGHQRRFAPVPTDARYEGVSASADGEEMDNRRSAGDDLAEAAAVWVDDGSLSGCVRCRCFGRLSWMGSLAILQALNLAVIVVLAAYYRYGDSGGATTGAWATGASAAANSSLSSVFAGGGDGSGGVAVPWRWLPLPDETEVLRRIAFGSCSRQDVPQPQWDTLRISYQPDVVLLMGDNVYGDCQGASCDTLRNAYQMWADHPSLQGAARHLPFFATLDDHDYGQGDCHADNPYKDTALQMFAAFFQLQDTDYELPGVGEGVYRARIWGTEGQRLQVVLLDTRYGRSPFRSTGDPAAPYEPYDDLDQTTAYRMLSDAQWEWLEGRLLSPHLQSSPDHLVVRVDLTLIVSSVQVLNDQVVYEGWRHMPRERDRLYNLIARAQSEAQTKVLLLSGDRHVGGFYRYCVASETGNGTNTATTDARNCIDEVTASSWTHTIPLGAYGSNCTSSRDCDEVDPRRIGDLVRHNHFGAVDIDWEARTFSVALRRTEPSPNQIYVHLSRGDAGDVLQLRNYSLL